MTFAEQAEQYLGAHADDRKNTFRSYRSMLRNHLIPLLGGLSMEDVDNRAAKLVVTTLRDGGYSHNTVTLALAVLMNVVASVVDEKGARRFRVDWNPDFYRPGTHETPEAPITPSGTLQEALGRTNGPVKALIGLLGGTGLRISEALALGLGNTWDPEAGTITVLGTMVQGQFQPHTKTKAGKRTVDLHPAVNALLKATYTSEDARKSTLFPSSEKTYRRQIDTLGIPGFHSLRRFRITHLQGESAPPMLTKFWAGHAAGDITEQYTKMGVLVSERKNWSEKAGLGFEL